MATIKSAALLIGAALGMQATAADAQAAVSFSGYGTLGVVHSDLRTADYLVDAFKPNGPGATREWSADTDSRLGAQVTASLSPRLSGVVQVLAQQRYDNTYRPIVEWANVKYEVTPDLSLRAGRIVLPIFMVTDSRRVGFGNVWVRPPVEVYSMVPVTSSDGADAAYRTDLGGAIVTAQVTAGKSDSRFPRAQGIDTGEAQARRLMLAVGSIERGAATLRASYGEADLTINSFDPLFDAFRQFGPPGAAIADRYDIDRRRVTFAGVGASYDPGAWFVMGEWARFDTRSVLGSRSAWYVSAGHRFGKLTPYATYARTHADSATSDPGLPLAALPPSAQGLASGLNAALNEQLDRIPRQRTVSVGARWDLLANAAIKLQYDEVRPEAGSQGTFGQLQPGYVRGSRARLFSVAVDFLF
jgi:hypothetical protein